VVITKDTPLCVSVKLPQRLHNSAVNPSAFPPSFASSRLCVRIDFPPFVKSVANPSSSLRLNLTSQPLCGELAYSSVCSRSGSITLQSIFLSIIFLSTFLLCVLCVPCG